MHVASYYPGPVHGESPYRTSKEKHPGPVQRLHVQSVPTSRSFLLHAPFYSKESPSVSGYKSQQ